MLLLLTPRLGLGLRLLLLEALNDPGLHHLVVLLGQPDAVREQERGRPLLKPRAE